MDGFKNTTKTQYMKGGACEGYAKGGAVKGAAKISKVMSEFKSGTLHSGSKKGPEVSNPKQAVAIALSEARKAGAKVPVKKRFGGPIVDESSEERVPNLANAPDNFRKRKGLEVKQTTVREIPADDSAISRRLRQLPSERGEMRGPQSAPGFRSIPLVGRAMNALGLKKGGLAAMPRSKK